MSRAKPSRVLVIDSEPQTRHVLRVCLMRSGYVVSQAPSGREALAQAVGYLPDVIILDLILPDMDGIELILRLQNWSQAPILVLSAQRSGRAKVAALDAGADDYITKPFSASELTARVRAALRHRRPMLENAGPLVEVSELQLDLALRRVRLRGQEIHLTPTEYDLLRFFLSRTWTGFSATMKSSGACGGTKVPESPPCGSISVVSAARSSGIPHTHATLSPRRASVIAFDPQHIHPIMTRLVPLTGGVNG